MAPNVFQKIFAQLEKIEIERLEDKAALEHRVDNLANLTSDLKYLLDANLHKLMFLDTKFETVRKETNACTAEISLTKT